MPPQCPPPAYQRQAPSRTTPAPTLTTTRTRRQAAIPTPPPEATPDGPTTDTHAHTAADDPPAPCQGWPGENSSNAPASEPQSRGTQGPATPPMSARASTTGTLAALVAAATTLALALDTRPHAAQRHDTPRRVIRRTATGSLALAGTLLIATMTRRAIGACASPTPAPGDDIQRTPGDADGTPIDLSGDALGDGPPDHDNVSDPPPAEPPLEGIAECLKDAIMKDLWCGVLELGLSASDALRRAETNARALIDSNRALARWAHPVMLHITRELGNPLLPGWFQLTCYRDKRDTLLSYGATRQVATARARQASEQISDRQLFREHDPRTLAPAGWYHWDQPPTTAGMWPYDARLRAARATNHSSDEDDDSDTHDSSEGDQAHGEP